MKIRKIGGSIEFFINELSVLYFFDDGTSFGPILEGEKIGFRQMAPLSAEYSDFKVFKIRKIGTEILIFTE